MARELVRLQGAPPERLRELIQLELLCTAQRARRRIAVHLAAIGAAPLLVATLSNTAFGAWRAFVAESWLVVATAAVGLWLLELGAVRRLDRALHPR